MCNRLKSSFIFFTIRKTSHVSQSEFRIARWHDIRYKHAAFLRASFRAHTSIAGSGQLRIRMLTAKMRLSIVFLLATLGIGIGLTGQSGAQVVSTGSAVTVTLREQLEFGLLARTPDERAFVAKVVALVNDGTLPQSLVQSTFLWARYKRPYPMPFFRQALILRAQSIGIRL